MDNYLLLKLIHVLSATVLMGTGAGIAFFMFMANRSEDWSAIRTTARHVILADWIFTTPAVVVQIVTGVGLMHLLGYSFHSEWFIWVAGCFVLVGICWLPVVYIQYQLKKYADIATQNTAAFLRFKQLMRLWTLLGIPAFLLMLVIYWLMIFKPLSVT